jgi:hypothetical protein
MTSRRPLLITAILLGGAWVGDGLVGHALGRWCEAHFASKIAAIGGSKVPDDVQFVSNRLAEALWLVTLTWLAVVSMVVLCHWIKRNVFFPWIAGVGLFVVLNVWCWFAGQTALFWLVLRGPTVQNQAQFRAKEILLGEVKIHPRLALLGSSQSQAQFTEEVFNAQVAGKAWMMELHFPGSQCADVYLVARRFNAAKVDAFVVYTSPGFIYNKKDSAVARDLPRLGDLPAAISVGAWQRFDPETARYMVLGMLLPLFQDRGSFQHALLGATALEAPNPPPVPGPAPRPDPTFGYALGGYSDFEKAAFRKFLGESASKSQRVIVIGGQMNPDYEAKLPPEIRPDFEKFMRECVATYPNVTLVWQNELLVQNPDAYRDHDHVTDATSVKFTQAFAQWYEKQDWHAVFSKTAPRQ